MVDIKEAELVFFKAMQEGWAAGAKEVTNQITPGFKVIVWEDGDWRVLDSYAVGPDLPLFREGGKSVGSTTIWYQGTPIWVMYYGGYYNKRAIPFLKQALLAAYRANAWYSGRGPSIYQISPHLYY